MIQMQFQGHIRCQNKGLTKSCSELKAVNNLSLRIEKGELRQVDPNIAAWYLTEVFSTYDARIVGHGKLPSEEEIRAVVNLALEDIKKDARAK